MKYVRAKQVEKLLNFVEGEMAHIYDAPISITHATKEEAYEHGAFSGTRDGKYTAYNSVRSRLHELLSSARFLGVASARHGNFLGEWVESADDAHCSLCGKQAIEGCLPGGIGDYELLTPCCPWCGAIMRNAKISAGDDE